MNRFKPKIENVTKNLAIEDIQIMDNYSKDQSSNEVRICVWKASELQLDLQMPWVSISTSDFKDSNDPLRVIQYGM